MDSHFQFMFYETVGALRLCNGAKAHGQAGFVGTTFLNDQIEVLHTINDRTFNLFAQAQIE